jgi:hypothetical protein
MNLKPIPLLLLLPLAGFMDHFLQDKRTSGAGDGEVGRGWIADR